MSHRMILYVGLCVMSVLSACRGNNGAVPQPDNVSVEAARVPSLAVSKAPVQPLTLPLLESVPTPALEPESASELESTPALEPAPEPVARLPLSSLMGLSEGDLMTLLGTPDYIRREEGVLWWQYRTARCTADILFKGVSKGRVVTVITRRSKNASPENASPENVSPADATPVSDEVCLGLIRSS